MTSRSLRIGSASGPAFVSLRLFFCAGPKEMPGRRGWWRLFRPAQHNRARIRAGPPGGKRWWHGQRRPPRQSDHRAPRTPRRRPPTLPHLRPRALRRTGRPPGREALHDRRELPHPRAAGPVTELGGELPALYLPGEQVLCCGILGCAQHNADHRTPAGRPSGRPRLAIRTLLPHREIRCNRSRQPRGQ